MRVVPRSGGVAAPLRRRRRRCARQLHGRLVPSPRRGRYTSPSECTWQGTAWVNGSVAVAVAAVVVVGTWGWRRRRSAIRCSPRRRCWGRAQQGMVWVGDPVAIAAVVVVESARGGGRRRSAIRRPGGEPFVREYWPRWTCGPTISDYLATLHWLKPPLYGLLALPLRAPHGIPTMMSTRSWHRGTLPTRAVK